MDIDPQTVKQAAPGVAGVIVAALMSFKDGFLPILTTGAAGLIVVWVLGGVVAKYGAVFGLPHEVSGFLLGGFACKVFRKIAETIQALEIAQPINGLIERWTGAKAPK